MGFPLLGRFVPRPQVVLEARPANTNRTPAAPLVVQRGPGIIRTATVHTSCRAANVWGPVSRELIGAYNKIAPKRGVEIHSEAYGPHPNQRVDFYLPKDVPMVGWHGWYHGGGWVMGDPALGVFIARPLARKGVGVASIGYRLEPQVSPAQQLEDARRGLELAQRMAPKFGGREGAFLLGGESAGANIALRLAQQGKIDVPTALDLFYGVYGIDGDDSVGFGSGVFNAAATWALHQLAHVSSRGELVRASGRHAMDIGGLSSPVRLYHGTHDRLAPYLQSVALQSFLAANGIDATLFTAEGQDHAFIYPFLVGRNGRGQKQFAGGTARHTFRQFRQNALDAFVSARVA